MQSNILQNRRTPNSEAGVSVQPPTWRCLVPSPGADLPSGKPPTGLHVLLRTGRDITNVADLGRDSQKALPRSCLGSIAWSARIPVVTPSVRCHSVQVRSDLNAKYNSQPSKKRKQCEARGWGPTCGPWLWQSFSSLVALISAFIHTFNIYIDITY